MIVYVLVLVVASSLLVAAVLVPRRLEARAWRRELVAYRLRFKRGLDPKAATEFFGGLSGLVAPRRERRVGIRAIVIETTATAAGIAHHLLAPRSLAPIVLAQLRAALPDASIQEVPVLDSGRPTIAGEVGISTRERPLRTDDPAVVSTAILASLQPLSKDERVILQWIVSPVGPVPLATAESGGKGWLAGFLDSGSDQARDAESLRALRAKQATSVFQAVGRLGATAASEPHADRLLHRLTAALHAANAPGVHLFRRAVPGAWAARRLELRSLPLGTYPCTLNAQEVAGLAAFPIGSPVLPGLDLGGSRQLPAVADIPTVGRVLARSNFPGSGDRPIALSPADALMGLHVMGPSGVGKSTLARGLVGRDMADGFGVMVIEPKSDLVRDVLSDVPPGRADDVVVLDPADDGRPVGLNILAGAEDAPELVVDRVVGIFHQLWKPFWGPRTDDILRAGLLTLVQDPAMTLCELPLLLTDRNFRAPLVGRIEDPFLQGFWGGYEGMSDAERAAAAGPLMNKLRAVLLRPRIRNVIGQSRPRLDLDRAIAERRIVLVPLSKGVLGEEAARLLGSLVLSRAWQSVLRRSAIPPERRHPVFLYVDEVQDYLGLPTSVADILAQARGLGMGVTLLHQHLGQLTPEVKEAVLANARSRVLFQLRSADARVMARELAPYIDAQDLEGLGRYEVVVSLMAGGHVVPPATGVSLSPPPSTGQAEIVRALSRERYGRDRAEIEAAMRARHGERPGPGPVGRRRRQP